MSREFQDGEELSFSDFGGDEEEDIDRNNIVSPPAIAGKINVVDLDRFIPPDGRISQAESVDDLDIAALSFDPTELRLSPETAATITNIDNNALGISSIHGKSDVDDHDASNESDDEEEEDIQQIVGPAQSSPSEALRLWDELNTEGDKSHSSFPRRTPSPSRLNFSMDDVVKKVMERDLSGIPGTRKSGLQTVRSYAKLTEGITSKDSDAGSNIGSTVGPLPSQKPGWYNAGKGAHDKQKIFLGKTIQSRLNKWREKVRCREVKPSELEKKANEKLRKWQKSKLLGNWERGEGLSLDDPVHRHWFDREMTKASVDLPEPIRQDVMRQGCKIIERIVALYAEQLGQQNPLTRHAVLEYIKLASELGIECDAQKERYGVEVAPRTSLMQRAATLINFPAKKQQDKKGSGDTASVVPAKAYRGKLKSKSISFKM